MVQIPEFKSKTGLTSQTGTRARPVPDITAAAAAPFEAAAELAGDVQKVSTRFYEAQKSLQRKTEATKLVDLFLKGDETTPGLNQLSYNAQNNPNTNIALQEYQTGYDNLLANLSKNAKDPVVKQIFTSKANELYNNEYLNVQSSVWKNIREDGLRTLDQNINFEINKILNAGGNKAQEFASKFNLEKLIEDANKDGLGLPEDYFNTILTAGGAQSITGVGFQPDLVWNKRREDTSDHYINDAVRGATKILFTNQTVAEQTSANFMSSFDSDGFTTGSGYWNSGASIVAWNWLASNTTASNTDGSITSTVSANTTSGFSISTFTTPASGTFTVGHGLGVAPKWIIYRPVTVSGWQIGHDSIGWTKAVFFDTQSEQTSTAFGNTNPTTSVWTGNVANVGANASSVAYCFAEVKGFSKFGSYVGNGNADGTFVYTGFKPAFVIVKRTNAAEDWFMFDNKRSASGGSNVLGERLKPNTSDSGYTTAYLDFLSNGFKWRVGGTGQNGLGDSYIYMAFAEEPLVGDNPATAR